MKKYKFVFIIFAFVVAIIITATVLIARYIVIHKDDLIYRYMLYDHIEYNGNAYYAKYSHERPSGEGVSSEKRGPVYLVCGSRKINYERCNTAYVLTGYDGEEEEIYLFFDSAEWIRGDYLNKTTDIEVNN